MRLQLSLYRGPWSWLPSLARFPALNYKRDPSHLSLAEIRLGTDFPLPRIKGRIGVQLQVSLILSSPSCILHSLSHRGRTLLLLLMPSTRAASELVGRHFHTGMPLHWEVSLRQPCTGRTRRHLAFSHWPEVGSRTLKLITSCSLTLSL